MLKCWCYCNDLPCTELCLCGTDAQVTEIYIYIQVEGKMKILKLDYDQKSRETRELLKSSERRKVAYTSADILVDN